MATQKEVKLVFGEVEIEVLVTETCNDILIQFFNPGTMDFVENLSQIQLGWSFSDKTLQKEYEKLVEMAKSIDEKHYKDASNGEIINFDENENPKMA